MRDERDLVGTLHPQVVNHGTYYEVPPMLDDLGLQYGTDKSSAHHDYLRRYDEQFWLRRYDEIVLVELGVGGHADPAKGGASLLMWREYFPNATIIGVDNERKNFTIDGVNIVLGDQASSDIAADVVRKYGRPDIVIDDASHISSLTIGSIQTWWPHVQPGGWYCVEDLHASYHSWFYGSGESNPDPDGTTTFRKPTAMQFLRRMADDVMLDPNASVSGRSWRLFPQRYWFTYDLCIMRKHPKAS
jgi:hypothetical protein